MPYAILTRHGNFKADKEGRYYIFRHKWPAVLWGLGPFERVVRIGPLPGPPHETLASFRPPGVKR